ncbi:MAG: hypothetical protein NT070_16405 [Cyanobacteria bacterium]|nr:hypothetical protein [Cyanobacteriota bacterium]
MSFDNTCRRLAELFPSDFASWVLGRKVNSSQLSPTELSNELIRADSIILLQNSEEVVHIEFQTRYRTHLRSNPETRSLAASWFSSFSGRKRFC